MHSTTTGNACTEMCIKLHCVHKAALFLISCFANLLDASKSVVFSLRNLKILEAYLEPESVVVLCIGLWAQFSTEINPDFISTKLQGTAIYSFADWA